MKNQQNRAPVEEPGTIEKYCRSIVMRSVNIDPVPKGPAEYMHRFGAHIPNENEKIHIYIKKQTKPRQTVGLCACISKL